MEKNGLRQIGRTSARHGEPAGVRDRLGCRAAWTDADSWQRRGQIINAGGVRADQIDRVEKVQRHSSITKQESGIREGSGSKVNERIIALAIGGGPTVSRTVQTVGANGAIVHTHSLQCITQIIHHPPTDTERGRRANRDDNVRAGKAAFHVADLTTHNVLPLRAPILAHAAGVAAESIVAEVPIISQCVAVAIIRGGDEIHEGVCSSPVRARTH